MLRSVEYRRVSDLVPNLRNPKAHDLKLLDASVSRFGYVEPIVLDHRTGMIVSGHGRMETLGVMEARGEQPPDGVSVDQAGAWTVPVVVGWESRSDSEAAAALVALNRASEVGGWDDVDLIAVLSELNEVDDGLVGVGFDEAELDRLLRVQESMLGGTDVLDEWAAAGLGDLNNENKLGVYHVHVSFATHEDYVDFRHRLELAMPPRTRIWFPEQPNLVESQTERARVG